MWLPRDERHLLMAYYVNIFNIDDRNVSIYVDKPKWFVISNWTRIFEIPKWFPILTPWMIKQTACKVKGYFDTSTAADENSKSNNLTRKAVKKHIEYDKRLKIANTALEKRKLIRMQKHECCDDVAGIDLTIEGYDLGRKYSSWWTRSGLWFAEYKNHWIWLIVSFVGGIIGALLINWLSKGD